MSAPDALDRIIAAHAGREGPLLPILRDRGELNTRFGTLFMGAGAWGEFGPIIAISVLLGTQSSFIAIISLVVFGVLALILATLPSRLAGDRVRELLARGHHGGSLAQDRLLRGSGLLFFLGSFFAHASQPLKCLAVTVPPRP